jgi:hypothetical protein
MDTIFGIGLCTRLGMATVLGTLRLSAFVYAERKFPLDLCYILFSDLPISYNHLGTYLYIADLSTLSLQPFSSGI